MLELLVVFLRKYFMDEPTIFTLEQMRTQGAVISSNANNDCFLQVEASSALEH
jgi:hypothetical protein